VIEGFNSMITPLHTPRGIGVLMNSSDEPDVVTRNGRQIQVSAIMNTWRIDDDWWRDEISRQYFQVELKSGLIITIFHDLVSGRWYEQRY
jgi:hypothetical protein